MATESGLVAGAGLVAGVVGSGFGGASVGDGSGAGFVAKSWRGRFGSGVGVVGSVGRLRPRAIGLAIAKGDSQ